MSDLISVFIVTVYAAAMTSMCWFLHLRRIKAEHFKYRMWIESHPYGMDAWAYKVHRHYNQRRTLIERARLMLMAGVSDWDPDDH